MVVAAFATAPMGVTEGSAQSDSPKLAGLRKAPQSHTRPASARFYRPELDALRFLAFLMVWISHSLPTASEGAARGIAPAMLWWIEAVKDAGNFGVCIFFFLSAYLITELLRRERATTGSIHLGAFYVRRILRIWPLYLGVLAVYGLLGLGFHGFRIEPGRLLASILMAGNWYIAFHPAILTPMRALWSLSVEEQFYVAWPLLARFIPRAAAMATICAGLLITGQITLVWLTRSTGEPAMLHVTAWVNSLVQFQFFALGGLAALVLAGRTLRLGAATRIAMLAGAAAAMLAASGVCGIKRPLPSHSAASLVAGYLLTGLGCVLLFASVLGLHEQGAARRWASGVPGWLFRVAIRLGQVSFGLYVFHETGFFFANALQKRLVHYVLHGHPAPVSFVAAWHAHWALALAANKILSLGFTILLALASYHYWERPFLKLKDRFTFVRSRLA